MKEEFGPDSPEHEAYQRLREADTSNTKLYPKSAPMKNGALNSLKKKRLEI